VNFFFPDAQDLVDPNFDFVTEMWSENRIRQRDDLYAHEIFETPAFDGLLVSKGIVDGFGETGSRYSIGQRHRLLRNGAREFFRLRAAKYPLTIMGDCGAFTYLNEKAPPYSVSDVVNFYEDCGFDLGVSVDHVILAYQPRWDAPGESPPEDVAARQALTLTLAREYYSLTAHGRAKLQPLGVAQGWSPKSYAYAVAELQNIGFDYIALGGMVPLKSAEILACLEAIRDVRKPGTRLHLLGITRIDHIGEFARLGVASFDSTSPLRQAFKDDNDNYYTETGALPAIRIPQVDGNPALSKAISAGRVSQSEARGLELAALDAMARFDRGEYGLERTVEVLAAYDRFYATVTGRATTAGRKRRAEGGYEGIYRDVLAQQAWKHCGCAVCRSIGYHVILFRGAERNRRRGFHNTWVFYQRLQRESGAIARASVA
jgi:hypothetical protein